MNRRQQSSVRKSGERGSALLIVFVLAAMIAIMLYMEMPVAVFEAQRQKEQLLIDRGNEYAHAVKLFVRKLGTYPASMDALEKTNQMRFLRHRFKDPFTGKEDWRVLHAGANGIIIDSKVKPVGLTGNGSGSSNSAATQNGTTGGGLFGSSSNSTNPASSSPFGSSTSNSGSASSSSSSNSSALQTVVPPLPQRAPAVAANGSGQPAAGGTGDNPLAPLLPPGQAEANLGTAAEPGQNAAPGQQTASTGQNGAAGGTNQIAGVGNTGSPQAGTGNATTGTGSTGTGSSLGVINTGGIAGVASMAKGHTIKVVNDQTDYSLWEFFYDPTKDATKGIANALGSMGAGQQSNGGIGQNSQSNSSSPFSIGNSSGSNSGNTSTSPPPLNNSTSPGASSTQNPQ